MKKEESHKVPEISIDEALKLYLSIAFPQGLPQGEEGERALEMLKKKIASDRPEWAKASGWASEEDTADEKKKYSEIKRHAIEEATKEVLPEDAEECYLFKRKQEALENSRARQQERQQEQRDGALRRETIKKKHNENEELLKRAALIKKILLKSASEKTVPAFKSEKKKINQSVSFSPKSTKTHTTIKHQPMGFSGGIHSGQPNDFSHSERASLQKGEKTPPDAQAWFKDFKQLSMEDRVKSIKDFNQRKREVLKSKEDLMWHGLSPSRESEEMKIEDADFDLDCGLTFHSDKREDTNMKLE